LADAAQRDRLRGFHCHVVQDRDFAEIFEDANRAMGIRAINDSDEDDIDLVTFSEDILKIEISGPDQNHLTVIDVPGIFRTATPGLTTESDITLVRNMVQAYMKDPRTIILAVIPCNVDIATQEILKLAKDADPNGIRTMGVLTKPDLAIERATQQAVLDLVQGKRNDLRLGYCVVKNRDADDKNSTLAQRHAKERAFFRAEPWSSIAATARVGIDSLKGRLRELLMDISRREFPGVKSEIAKRLADCRKTLEGMGPSRSDPNAQRLYLGKLSSHFQKLTGYALNAYYTEDRIFTERPEFRLITRIIELNEVFADVFWRRGHSRGFVNFGDEDEDGERQTGRDRVSFDIPIDDYQELQDIVETEPYECPKPTDDSIMDHIQQVFSSSRGPELGTVS
jgi:hypothetical protein